MSPATSRRRHNPIPLRDADVRSVDDVRGPWAVRARPSGAELGDGAVIGTYAARSDAVAAAMVAAHGLDYGAVTSYNQVTIRHVDDHGNAWPRWSALWRSGDQVWREYGRINDRGWTYAGRHAHAVRMAARQPPDQTPPAPGTYVGRRPVVTIDGRRYLLKDERGGVWSFLRPDGGIAYVALCDTTDFSELTVKVGNALAEPDNAVCDTCDAGRGAHCRPVSGETGYRTDDQGQAADL